MTKESIKKFIKEHKAEIITLSIGIASTTILMITGKKIRQEKSLMRRKEDNKEFMDLLSTVDNACKDCTVYVPITLEEIAATIDKSGIVSDLYEDPNGNLMEVKNLIAFGNKVEQ